MFIASQRGRRVLAATLAGVCVSLAAVPFARAQSVSLTTEEQNQESALASKLLDAIKALPPGTASGSYESAMIPAIEGYSATVIETALAQVAGTPGVPSGASEAARRLGRVYVAYSNGPNGSGPGGYFGAGSTPGSSGPSFVSGGGGGTSSSYHR
jgi:hypothetical protein